MKPVLNRFHALAPSFYRLAVVSTGRSRIHTAGDALGTADLPSDWKEPVIVAQSGRVDFSGSDHLRLAISKGWAIRLSTLEEGMQEI
jgi:hypothetical protein